jgi:MSHA biogenesis protein MshL
MSPPARACKTATVALAALGLLHGCALGPPPAATQTAIDAALQQAQQARPAPPVPEALTRALLPPLSAQQIAPTAIVEPRFDLHVTHAPLPQVLHAIGSGSRYSLLVSPALAGNVSLNLREVTVREALDALQELHGIEYRFEGTRVFVQPATLQTRLFQVSYPAARRQGRSETRVVSGSITANAPGAGGAAGAAAAAGAGSSPDGSQVSTTQDADFWREVEAALRALVGAEGGRQVTLSPHTGVVVVRAFPAELREVERFLQASRLAIERQVMLEAKIVEVALREGFESGINWANFDAAGNHRFSVGVDTSRINIPGSLGRQAGIGTGSLVTGIDASTTPPTVIPTTLGQLLASPLAGGGSGALGLAFTRNSFAALLSFMATHGSVQVLSSPRVAVTKSG